MTRFNKFMVAFIFAFVLDLQAESEGYQLMPIVEGIPEINCESEDGLQVALQFQRPFMGVIYPKGLADNEACHIFGNGELEMMYKLPFDRCGTVMEDLADGNKTYTNVIIIQNHPQVVTGDDSAFLVGCWFANSTQKMLNSTYSSGMIQTEDPLLATPAVPGCWLHISRILGGGQVSLRDPVRVGQRLVFSVEMDKSDVYGFNVYKCIVHDGNGLSQLLVDDNGCSQDENIFAEFTYDTVEQRVFTFFDAFKFPASMEVFFQCNVKLCLKKSCKIPSCSKVEKGRRKRREAKEDTLTDYKDDTEDYEKEDLDIDIDVESMIYVTNDFIHEDAQTLIGRTANSTHGTIRIRTSIPGICLTRVDLIATLTACSVFLLSSVIMIAVSWRYSVRRRTRSNSNSFYGRKFNFLHDHHT